MLKLFFLFPCHARVISGRNCVLIAKFFPNEATSKPSRFVTILVGNWDLEISQNYVFHWSVDPLKPGQRRDVLLTFSQVYVERKLLYFTGICPEDQISNKSALEQVMAWCQKGKKPIIWTWWRHQMETFSALLAFCAVNSLVTSEFSSQRPVTRNFDVFFDLRLIIRLSKQSWGWCFETPSYSLWCHCNKWMLTFQLGIVRIWICFHDYYCNYC